jgi:FlaA1/EpsC-like NDP-sugar epimerase
LLAIYHIHDLKMKVFKDSACQNLTLCSGSINSNAKAMISKKILAMPRNAKRLIVCSVDFILLPFALWASFSLRLGEFYLPEGDIRYLFLVVPVVAVPIFARLGLYRAIIRHIGFFAMWAVIKAVSLYTLVWGVIVLLSGVPGVPRSVLLINFLVGVLLIGGSRAIARWWLAGSLKTGSTGRVQKRVAIYGAGCSGIQIATALSGSPDFKPVAFIDDKKNLQRNYIAGLRVYAFGQLSSIMDDLQVTDVLLAIPSASRSRRNQIISMLEPFSIHITTVPGLDDLASGKVKVEDVREVGVRDLLGREAVTPDNNLLTANVKDKAVLVTGAGGSIGSELCRQIIKIGPKELILYERSEHALYAIENELRELAQRLYPGTQDFSTRITPILACVTNQNRLEKVCSAFAVQAIYHAAAYKHVPMVEKNPMEAVTNNIIGTYRSARAAMNTGVETFVLISTDKAVRPTNTMGASKRFAEMILQGLARQHEIGTRFTMVRFGNVLGSSGSVVPLFREQIKNGGPVTVTDPKIIRYFMTIPEASQLVIQAGAMGKGGDVFVLDMGEPVKIIDLAKRMIRLSGFEIKDAENPGGDIEISYSGLRPGEKLYEELLIGENVSLTQHELIMTAEEDCLSWPVIESFLERFNKAIESNDVEKVRSLLVEAVVGYSPQCEVADLVFGKNKRTSIAKTSSILAYKKKSL